MTLSFGTVTITETGLYNVVDHASMQISWSVRYPLMDTMLNSAKNGFAVADIQPGQIRVTGIIGKASYSLYATHIETIQTQILGGAKTLTANGKSFTNTLGVSFRAERPHYGLCTPISTTTKQYWGRFEFVVLIPEAV